MYLEVNLRVNRWWAIGLLIYRMVAMCYYVLLCVIHYPCGNWDKHETRYIHLHALTSLFVCNTNECFDFWLMTLRSASLPGWISKQLAVFRPILLLFECQQIILALVSMIRARRFEYPLQVKSKLQRNLPLVACNGRLALIACQRTQTRWLKHIRW